MKKKLTQKELAELRKREQHRKELEYDLHHSIESDYRAQEKYMDSGRLMNFFSGISIGFVIFFIVKRFFFGGIITIIPLDQEHRWVVWVLEILFLVGAGYYNMITMGRFSKSVKDFFDGFFR